MIKLLIAKSLVLWLKIDHKNTGSIAYCCNSMQELLWLKRLAGNEVQIHAGNIVNVTILTINVLPLWLFS